jgi:hypothetical protein
MTFSRTRFRFHDLPLSFHSASTHGFDNEFLDLEPDVDP